MAGALKQASSKGVPIMLRALLYSAGLNYLFRRLGGRGGYGGYGGGYGGYGRMRPFSRRW